MDKPAKIVPSDPFAFLDEAALPSAPSHAPAVDAPDWRARWRAWPALLRFGFGALVLSVLGAALGAVAAALSALAGGPLLAGWAAAGIGAVAAVLSAPLVAWISAPPAHAAAAVPAAAASGSEASGAWAPAGPVLRPSAKPQLRPFMPPAMAPSALASTMRTPAAPALPDARAAVPHRPERQSERQSERRPDASAPTVPPARPQPAPSATVTGADGSDIRDSLTGAYTQRYFIAAADREWSRIRRHGGDAALLMIDPDHLRGINDAHGMDCGDAALVQLARLVTATLRQYDLMARFNAGVLVVYLPHTDPIGAIDVAERIRDRIASHRMQWSTGTVTLTVSVGVAAVGADHVALDAVIGDAGAALRQAKAAGRNCVRASPVPPKRLPSSGAARGDRRAH